jgi:predicted dehydrogenase
VEPPVRGADPKDERPPGADGPEEETGMKTIRTAVLGNGFARTVVLPCLRSVPALRVVGIASPNLEKTRATAAAFGIEHVAVDHREILEKARPDLVFVVTPPFRHADMVTDVLEAGCHCVCEKPMARNGAETARMVAAGAAHPDRITIIDHELRFLPARAELARRVADGTLGSVLHADYTLRSPGRRDPSLPWTWWSELSAGGGALGALGSHAVDALRLLLGEVAAVRGQLATFVQERIDPANGRPRPVTSDDYAAAWLRFTSGALATLTISLVEGERVHRVGIAGTQGSAEVVEQGPLRVGRGTDRWVEVPCDDGLPPSADLGIPETDWARAFLRMTRLLAQRIAAGESTLPGAATFEDGHRTQLVLDAIRRSSESARWVEVGPVGSRGSV